MAVSARMRFEEKKRRVASRTCGPTKVVRFLCDWFGCNREPPARFRGQVAALDSINLLSTVGETRGQVLKKRLQCADQCVFSRPDTKQTLTLTLTPVALTPVGDRSVAARTKTVFADHQLFKGGASSLDEVTRLAAESGLIICKLAKYDFSWTRHQAPELMPNLRNARRK